MAERRGVEANSLHRHLPGQAAQYSQFQRSWSHACVKHLKNVAFTAFTLTKSRRFSRSAKQHVVVATPTASGKSLCYNLPILDAFAKDPSARALYLFPTKALSRDQEVSLQQFMRDAGLSQGAITFDGDTPGDARRVAKRRAGVLVTNPDMLHAGILHHASWARLCEP